MRKRDELTDPTSCMNRAYNDELTFVLLSRDKCAPAAIRAWVKYRLYDKNKSSDPQIVEALCIADAMEMQRDEIRCRKG